MINLTLKDFDMIKFIHDYIGSKTRKIYHNKGCFSINIVNPNTINFFENIGLTERKSLTLNFPNIPDEFIPDFIRGFFDGDGCAYKSTTTSNKIKYDYIFVSFTSGSDSFIEKLKNILKNNNIKSTIVNDSRNNHNAKYLKIYSKESVKNFYNYIYYNDDVVCLNRKKNKFKEVDYIV